MNTVEPAPIMAIFVMCRPWYLQLIDSMRSYASTSSAARTSRLV